MNTNIHELIIASIRIVRRCFMILTAKFDHVAITY
jgi:hypothetical protein